MDGVVEKDRQTNYTSRKKNLHNKKTFIKLFSCGRAKETRNVWICVIYHKIVGAKSSALRPHHNIIFSNIFLVFPGPTFYYIHIHTLPRAPYLLYLLHSISHVRNEWTNRPTTITTGPTKKKQFCVASSGRFVFGFFSNSIPFSSYSFCVFVCVWKNIY